MDVQKWDVDFCFFSFYKIYGPHVSVLYTRSTSLDALTPLTHHFLKVDGLPYKLQPGGPGYEIIYSTTSVLPYLLSLTPASNLDASFDAITAHEQTLLKPLLEFLTDEKQAKRGIRVVGSAKIGLERVPTISFIVVGERSMKSKDVVKVFDQKGGIGIRYGHFYAYTLVDNLSPKLDVDDGVVRISLVHYNTVQEVEKIIEILKEVFA
jgi:selenocysteine lyase/cysteine desulfurase